MSRKTDSLPLLDAGRGLAALAVLVYHTSIHFQFSEPVTRVMTVGGNGVTIFFVISGFLIARPFIQARLDDRPGPGLRRYATHRLLRIIPAYWVALTLAIVVGGKAIPGGPLIYYGFAQTYSESWVTGGLGPAWTLCVEVLYYLMLPLLAVALVAIPARTPKARVRREVLAVAALAAIGVAYKVILNLSYDGGLYTLPILHLAVLQDSLPWALDAFALGMFAALMREGVVARRLTGALGRHPALCLGASVVAVFVITQRYDLGSDTVLWDRLWQLVLAGGLLAPMFFGEPSAGLVRRVLGQRALLWAGVVSYSIYLYNQSVATTLADHMPGSVPAGLRPWAGLFIGLVITLTVAALSHRFIEAPAQRLARRRT